MKDKKLAIIGTHGIPANYGGFETFAEEFAIRCVQYGLDVLVIANHDSYNADYYKGVRVICSRYAKSSTPILYYLDSYAIAYKEGYRKILLTGVGGALIGWFFDFFGIKTYLNPDGLGFLRSKYSRMERAFFKLLYRIASLTMNEMIFDSPGIRDYFVSRFKYSGNYSIIEYGVREEDKTRISVAGYEAMPLSNKYSLVVARLEPENNVEMIIEGYINSDFKDTPLYIVGSTSTKEGKRLKLLYAEHKLVVFLNGIYDKAILLAIRQKALFYFHGHSVGGTNPSLLEAMVVGNICICHDNIFNRHITGNYGYYFNNSDELSELLNTEILTLVNNPYDLNKLKREVQSFVSSRFSWNAITTKYCKAVGIYLEQ